MTQTTAEQVKEVREREQCSMQTAVMIVRRQQLEKRIQDAQTVTDLKVVMLEIVRWIA